MSAKLALITTPTEVDPDFERDLAALVDGTPWKMADRLLDRYPVHEWGDPTSSAHSGLYAEFDKYEVALRRDYGIELSISTMASSRATAHAWTPRARARGAPYVVHRELRTDPNRERILAQLLKRHDGRVTKQQLRNWKQEQTPSKPLESWLAMVERRLRLVVSLAKTPESRSEVADLLGAIANELRHDD